MAKKERGSVQMNFLVPLLEKDLAAISTKIAKDANPRRRGDSRLNVLPEDALPKRKKRKKTKEDVRKEWEFQDWYREQMTRDLNQ